MARKKGGKKYGTANHTIIGNSINHPKAIVSIVMCLLVLTAECIGFWLLTERQVELNDTARMLRALGVAELEDLLMKRTIILGIVSLLLMIYPMIEYLFVFHNRTAKRKGAHSDKYQWFVCPIVAGIFCLMTIFIMSEIMLCDIWIILVQIVAMAIVILIPRFLLQPM